MFNLSISASVILAAPALPANAANAPGAPSKLPAAEFLNVSVSPSMFRRWSADIFGDDRLDDASAAAETFDIRVDWGSGACSELRGVPLNADDTLVIDPCGEVLVSTQRDNALSPSAMPFLR